MPVVSLVVMDFAGVIPKAFTADLDRENGILAIWRDGLASGA